MQWSDLHTDGVTVVTMGREWGGKVPHVRRFGLRESMLTLKKNESSHFYYWLTSPLSFGSWDRSTCTHADGKLKLDCTPLHYARSVAHTRDERVILRRLRCITEKNAKLFASLGCCLLSALLHSPSPTSNCNHPYYKDSTILPTNSLAEQKRNVDVHSCWSELRSTWLLQEDTKGHLSTHTVTSCMAWMFHAMDHTTVNLNLTLSNTSRLLPNFLLWIFNV